MINMAGKMLLRRRFVILKTFRHQPNDNAETGKLKSARNFKVCTVSGNNFLRLVIQSYFRI
jgi:hypothetical protein